ncbi:MAG: glycosyltransferase family 2 protein [Promethearchaeota archaeon]
MVRRVLGTKEGMVYMAKFSILTACYDKEKFIQQCVESVIAQTYDNWELVIVDDCSTDGSYAYLSSLTDPRIRVIRHEERKHCSSCYATALNHATGDLCGVVDGDDVLAKKAMSIIVKRYRAHPEVDYIYTQHFWCDASLVSKRTGLSSAPKKGKSLAEMARAGRHCFSHWRTFRRSLADKGTLFPEGLEVSVDKNLGFILEELGRGAFLGKKLYFYRYYKGNMSLMQGERQKATTHDLATKRLAQRIEKNIIAYPVVPIS